VRGALGDEHTSGAVLDDGADDRDGSFFRHGLRAALGPQLSLCDDSRVKTNMFIEARHAERVARCFSRATSEPAVCRRRTSFSRPDR